MQAHVAAPAVPAIRALSTFSTEGGGLSALTKIIMDKLGMGGNEFASGGLTLAVLGAVVAGARMFGGYLVDAMKRQCIVSAEFDSNRAGTHLFTYNNRLLWLSRERAKTLPGAAGASISPERITINCLGRSRSVLESLVQTAQTHYIQKDAHRTVIYSADQYGNWRRTRSKPVRPLSTVVLDGDVKETFLKDVKEFLGSEKWYADRGIPYRRGYMFHGKPGTGKTSFVTTLAGELRFNIYVISLANKGLTDETLTELMVDTPGRCILLLEDIDAAFVSRGITKDASASSGATVTNVTFSGLLNAIDGVAAQEGRILCMTTNHLEKLDEALIRPGRIDHQVHFDLASSHQIRELFLQFYPHSPSSTSSTSSLPYTEQELIGLADEFEKKVEGGKWSMAQIQGLLMRWKSDPRGAVEAAEG
ncbi:hypothetical protein HK097_010756, partial [Rhizophlyctis rosea]